MYQSHSRIRIKTCHNFQPYSSSTYTTAIVVFWNTVYFYFLTEVYVILDAVVLRYMLGLFCNRTNKAMSNYGVGYDNGDDNWYEKRNKYGNNNKNAASV